MLTTNSACDPLNDFYIRRFTVNKLNALLLASTLTFPALVLADHDASGDHCERHGKGMFSEADTNKDGSIDKAEAQAMHEKHFNKMDVNHDGKLSPDEVKAGKHSNDHMHDKGSMGFKNADKDNDGTLDREEAKKLPHVSKNFDAIDVDKDGTVDRDEVHNYMKNQKSN
jgi:Ca2+-binding EF-hand superfamily protein